MKFPSPASKFLSVVSRIFALVVVACATVVAHAGSSTTLSITVKGGAAVTSVPAGTVVILTATVGVHPGLVKFCDATATYCTDQYLVGTAQLTPAGKATYRFIPGIGKHSYKAVFVGTQTEPGSSSAAEALTVDGSVAITSSGTPGNYTLAASVTGALKPVGGTVSFLDTTNGNASVGSAEVTNANTPLSFVGSASVVDGKNVLVGSILADFNGDGIPDLAVTNSTGLNVQLGKGDGTFGAPTEIASGEFIGLAAADFNGDGNLDLVSVNFQGNSASILLGAGNGTFAAQPSVTVGNQPTWAAVGDFNGDGIADLVVVNRQDNTISVAIGKGDGTFASPSTISVGNTPETVVVGDFNGDGIADLAVTNILGNSVSILLGIGNGTFATQPLVDGGNQPTWVAVGDFNGDGIPDLATANNLDNTVGILLGKGDGTFTAKAAITAGNSAISVAVADLDGDGILDLVCANYSDNTATIALGKGDGTFTVYATPALGVGPYSVAIADLNGDGKLDIAFADDDDDNESLLLNQGGNVGSVSLSGVSIPGNGTHAILASYGGDASNGTSDSTTVNLTATQVPTTLTVSASPTSATYGQQVVLTAKLTPYSAGNLSTNAENIVFQNNGANIGNGSLTSGTAVLNVTSLPVGTDSIVAVYGGDSNFVTSVSAAKSVTVSSASQATLSITPTSLSFASTPVGTTTAAQVVTIKNTGTAAVSFTASTTITGSGASSFIKSASTCTNPLPAGASCTNSIEFDPTVSGALSAVITYTDTAAGSPQTVALSGMGATASTGLTITPSSLTFQSTTVGASAATQVITLKNGTSAAVSFTASTTITGTGAGSFTKSASTCTNPLAAGASCTNTITFIPASAGMLTATVTYMDSASSAPQTVALSGTGTTAGTGLTITPSSLTFPPTAVGASAATQVITLKNGTSAAVSFTASTTITGTGASSFTKSASTCTNPLAAGASCTNTITFTPVSAGTLTATVTYMDSASSAPQTVALSGTGGTAGPTLTFTPSSLSFGSTAVGTTTAAQVVTIKNTGTTAVSFTASTTITGSGASSFIKSASTCTNPLPAGASCTNSIEFDPTVSGALSAVITYTDTAAGSPQTVALSGTGGSAGPTLTFTPSSLSFGSTAVGTTTAAQLVTIKNTGTTAVSFTASTTITGSGASSFIKSASTCTNPLPAGASCTNSIEFDPKAAGALSAVITYTDTAVGSPQTVGLSGTGH